MMMALFKCREKTNVMDTSSLLKEEQILFLQLVNILDSFRNSMLMNLLELKEIGTKAVEMPQHKNKGLVNNNRTNTDNNIRSESSNNNANVNTQQITAANENTNADTSAALKLLRILEQVPQFVGTDLEVYGPFIPEDVANIPADVANLLVETGSAEQMKNN